MTLLSFEEFHGLAPKIHPERLGEGFAQIAENARLDRSVLEGWFAPTPTENLTGSVQSIYNYRGSWLESTFPRQYVDALHPNDVRERIYYTDSNYPKIRSGNQEFKLGLPRPRSPSAVIRVEGDKTKPTDVFTTRYIVTLVDAWGAEGPASPASLASEVGLGFTIRVDLSSCRVTGPYNLSNGALFRIYRSNTTGSGAGLYQFVAQVPYGTVRFDDTIPRGELQEQIISTDWLAAPDNDTSLYPDGPLQSLVEIPGSVLAGHTGNTVFFSEPSVPTAWPYYYTNEHKIKAIVMTQSGLFCATTERPFLLAGSHPRAMAMVPIQSDQACVSSRSMVDMGGYGIYASHDGLVIAEGSHATLVTKELFDQQSWAQFLPSTIRAFRYESKYIAFYGGTGDGTGFVFDPMGGANTFTTFSGLKIEAAHYQPDTDDTSVALKDGNGWKVATFNTGERMTAKWQSGVQVFPDVLGFNCMRVRATQFPVTVHVKADGVDKGSFVFPDEQPTRLPGGYRARKWEVTVEGQGPVVGVYLADSMRELP